jgi:hypothetical protein
MESANIDKDVPAGLRRLLDQIKKVEQNMDETMNTPIDQPKELQNVSMRSYQVRSKRIIIKIIPDSWTELVGIVV